jgi:hypothetical protein
MTAGEGNFSILDGLPIVGKYNVNLVGPSVGCGNDCCGAVRSMVYGWKETARDERFHSQSCLQNAGFTSPNHHLVEEEMVLFPLKYRF